MDDWLFMNRNIQWKVSRVLFLSLVFLVVGCGEHDQGDKSGNKTTTMHQTVASTVDACTIVTQQEIESVLKEIVINPRLTAPAYKMTVCSWLSKQDPRKSALTVVYHTEAPLITWEQLKRQSEEYDIEIQQIDAVGDLAGWTVATGDLQVWASGKKIQIGRPFKPDLEKQRRLVRFALTRMNP